MAHQPVLRPGSFGSVDPDDEPLFASAEPRELDIARLTQTLAEHGGGDSSADLALDLVLNQIVEQARLATTATGAAIALMRDGELVCRATSGMNAPELGTRLSTRSGISGACALTRQVQRCDDTELDLRADAVALRPLGVRSILVLPLMEAEQLTGVFEILSPHPNAFGERDVQTLEALSRRIVFNIGRAADSAPHKRVSIVPAVEEDVKAEVDSEAATASASKIPAVDAPRRRDLWTEILNAIVIALALLLGWMVGREGWSEATRATRHQASTVEPIARPVPAQASEKTEPREPSPQMTTSSAPTRAKPPQKAKATQSVAAPDTGGLVVYEKGKLVYRWNPEGPRRESTPVYVRPETANTFVLRRVEPTYPEPAKERGIEGTVVLDAIIGREGLVRELKDVSGDPQLVEAALSAVRQWQFKPYAPSGTPVEFRTAITLNFRLP